MLTRQLLQNAPNICKGYNLFFQSVLNLCKLSLVKNKWINYVINLERKLKDHFNILKNENKHCVKSIHSYSGPYFPAFGLNTEIYGVFAQLLLLSAIYTVISKYIKQPLIALLNFNLFCQPLMHLHICQLSMQTLFCLHLILMNIL